jgi:hypothetical protein
MKCPLNLVTTRDKMGKVVIVAPECGGVECAWWEPKYQKCAMVAAAETLEDLSNNLDRLANTMAKERLM